MKMKMLQLQHGDVLIQAVNSIPPGTVPVPRRGGRLVVAEGELTGHAHTIVDEGATLLMLGNDLYMEVSSPVIITHEEHKPIPIPPGKYKIGRVVEYDYFTESSRQVRD